jgi:hypothetical protein
MQAVYQVEGCAAITTLFVLFLLAIKYLKCLGPTVVAFLLTSFEPPHMITASSLFNVLISLSDKHVTFSILEPGITIPLISLFSKVF